MVNVINLISDFLSYINVWKLPSRINRIKYFVIKNIYLLLSIPILKCLGLYTKSYLISIFLYVIIFFIFYLLVYLPLMIKRLHDCNLSGWWILVVFIPFVGIILFLVVLFMPGTKKSNRFGAVPKKANKVEFVATSIFIPWYIFITYSSFLSWYYAMQKFLNFVL
ncbi:MAG: DUF805 domain-containing protein [Rickettsiales bacterium]|nr:DUF805 domain-containing protein [Rickettsiales bacterium]